MPYLAQSTYDRIADNPYEVVAVYDIVKDIFARDLQLPELSEPLRKAAFCAIVAYGLAPYGPNPGSIDFHVLAKSPTLACAAYASITMTLVSEFGDPNLVTSAIGWDGGALGNHAQVLVSDGLNSALLDPTIGLVVAGATLDSLIWGSPHTRMSSFFDRSDIPGFNTNVIESIAAGRTQISDVIYLVPTYEDWVSHYSDFKGLEVERDGIHHKVGYLYNDTLRGNGDCWLYGGKGDDTYYVTGASDICIEKPGNGVDVVWSSGNYVLGANLEKLVLSGTATYGTGNNDKNLLFGNESPNVLSGLGGNDILYGRGGNDLLSGGDGRDSLLGGPGADILWGLTGGDSFYFESMTDLGVTSSTADLIMDFNLAQGDKIHLALIDANQNIAGNQAFNFVDGPFTAPGQIRAFHSAGETRIILNTDSDAAFEGLIRVAGLHQVTADWFVL